MPQTFITFIVKFSLICRLQGENVKGRMYYKLLPMTVIVLQPFFWEILDIKRVRTAIKNLPGWKLQKTSEGLRTHHSGI